MSPIRRESRQLGAVVLLVVVVSWLAREGHEQRYPLPERDSWGTLDSDTYYHLRRVDRALTEGMPPAGEDPYLNYPHGSPIPWPPYYAGVAWSLTAPFAPRAEAARRDFVERRVASLPTWFAVATTAVVALAGGALGGSAGALLAGGNHALSTSSIFYSRPGVGDHHAWIALLVASMLALAAAGFARGALARSRAGLAWGAATGSVLGLALGSWAGSALHALPLQLALGWLVIRNGGRPLPGLPAFGAAFHATAFLVLLPALARSPWNAIHPWAVVYLTWFHGAWLLLGALVFLPLGFVAPRSVVARAYPFGVAAFLGALGLFLSVSDASPAVGLREGFRWMAREDAFMGSVWESRGVGLHESGILLGWGYYLAPLLLGAGAWSAFRRDRFGLLPWVLAAAVLVPVSAQQYRFNEALAAPLSVLLGWGVVAAFRSGRVRKALDRRTSPRVRGALAGVTIVAALAIAHGRSVSGTVAGWTDRTPSSRHPISVVVRDLSEWIHRETVPGDYSVLAAWTHGHAIEWAADRPTVGTNFGIYVGEDSFLDASRFFLAEDVAEAESILKRRRSRYVLATGWLTGSLDMMALGLEPDRLARYADRRPGGGLQLRFEWFRTMGARLLFDGSVVDESGNVGPPLDFLRVVTVTPQRFPEPMMGLERPAGWVWERVPGAIVEARGAPGERLRLELRVRYPRGDYELTWGGEAVADAEGVARLRVPYATDRPNGDGESRGPARWAFGEGDAGTIDVPERAVLGGERVPIG